MVLCLATFLLFWPNLGRSFASDDFLVLRRVGLERGIFIKGFFRPLSDMTHYFSYLLGGFDPMGYYLQSMVIHAASAFVLFRFCWLWKWTDNEDMQWRFAFLSALLFLCYPFHNEAVSWVLGRASLLAGFFGISALVAVVSKWRLGWRIFLCCLCYFIGMAGYESVMLLPGVVFVLLYGRGIGLKEYGYWAGALGLTLLVHLAVREAVAGTIFGEYGAAFFGNRFLHYTKNVFVVTTRLFLPPMNSVRLLVVLSVLFMGILGVCFWIFFRKYHRRPKVRMYLLQWLFMLGVSLVVPFVAGVSSHTSESDRFLYFPSFFVCGGAAFVVTALVQRKVWLGWVAAALVIYNCLFLEQNNRHWIRASKITRQVLSIAEAQPRGSRLFLVNVPDEVEGAFVFRLGLHDAMVMDGKDSSRVVIVNHLTRDKARLLPDSIRVEEHNGVFYVAPEVRVKIAADTFLVSAGTGSPSDGSVDTAITWKGGRNDRIVYWNKNRLIEIKK